MLIQLDATTLVGVNKIDEEHKQLVAIANTLHEAMKAGKGREVEGDILNKLLEYTKTHFESEEKLMKVHGYTDYERHKKEHNSLMMDVYDALKGFQQGHAPLPASIMQFLKDWLMTHIRNTDRQLGVFLNARGVR